jgi:hypothetical protein
VGGRASGVEDGGFYKHMVATALAANDVAGGELDAPAHMTVFVVT